MTIQAIRRSRVFSRLRDERGMALVMALGIALVLTVAGTSVVAFATSNQGAASRTSASSRAFALAEAGMNNALAILANPANAAQLTNASLLPGVGAPTVDTSPGGGRTSSWYGEFTPLSSNGLTVGGTWKVVGIGSVPSPSTPGSTIVRRVHAFLPVEPTPTQTLTTDGWKYIYSKATGAVPPNCDVSVENNTSINSSMYVKGSLCLNTPTDIAGPKTSTSPEVLLYVGRFMNMDTNTNVGKSPNKPLTDVGIAQGCYFKWGSYKSICSKPNGFEVYPPSTTSIPYVAEPQANFPAWYDLAKPGPKNACTTVSGTPPTFENQTTLPSRDNSIPAVVNLTPATSYTCELEGGKLDWNASTKKLTVEGTIYIDGSATSTAPLVEYDGNAAIYLSGTFLLKNAKLCAIVTSGTCDTSAWSAAATPDILLIAAEEQGTGGSAPKDQVAATDSIEIKSSNFQGALYGEHRVEVDTSSTMQGPIVTYTALFSQTGGSPFPIFLNVPFGTPGNGIPKLQAMTPLNEQECGTSATPC